MSLPQDIHTAATPTFAGLNLTGLTASQVVVTDASKNLASLAYTSANTASTIVQRDGSGNFAAGTITGTSFVASSGLASAPVYSFAGDTDTGIYSAGTDQLNFSTGGISRLGIDASGNVTYSSNYKAYAYRNSTQSVNGQLRLLFLIQS